MAKNLGEEENASLSLPVCLSFACAGHCCLLSMVFTACALQSTEVPLLSLKNLPLSITSELGAALT